MEPRGPEELSRMGVDEWREGGVEERKMEEKMSSARTRRARKAEGVAVVGSAGVDERRREGARARTRGRGAGGSAAGRRYG